MQKQSRLTRGLDVRVTLYNISSVENRLENPLADSANFKDLLISSRFLSSFSHEKTPPEPPIGDSETKRLERS
jgi:hypothetical protein